MEENESIDQNNYEMKIERPDFLPENKCCILAIIQQDKYLGTNTLLYQCLHMHPT